MRAPAIGWAFESEADVLVQAELSAIPSHNHPEGIKGAQAVALSVFLARTGSGKDELRHAVAQNFGYDLDRTVDEIQPGYKFTTAAPNSVPEAIVSFLDSDSFESAIRNAVFIGGDSDTIACIAGSIAEAFYGGVPFEVEEEVLKRLPEHLADVYHRFSGRYISSARGSSAWKGRETQITGWLKTDSPSLDFIPQNSEIAQQIEEDQKIKEEIDRQIRGSDYFKKHVGYMQSENTDTAGLEPVDVEEVAAGPDVSGAAGGDSKMESEAAEEGELEDLYAEAVSGKREALRDEMRSRSAWFHDNGTEVRGEKHLSISIRAQCIRFVEFLSDRYGIEACIPDFLHFLDLYDACASLNFFIRTSDRIHVNLVGMDVESVKKVTVDAAGAAEWMGQLDTIDTTLWMINQIYWTDACRKTTWYVPVKKLYRKFLRRRLVTYRENTLYQ
jgi:hypothetical protein